MTTTRQSQNDQILKYLRTGKKISPLMALNRMGCLRLAARIREIKDQGIKIDSEMVYGSGYHYKRYWIKNKAA